MSVKTKKSFSVVIDKNLCKECQICVRVCPTNVFDIDERGIVYVKFEDSCIGCNICENLCPDFAIEVKEK